MQRTFKGIPDCWRATVWHEFLDTQATKLGDRETEQELIKSYHVLPSFTSDFRICLEQDCDDDAQIDLDVPRTISEHIFFRQRYGAGYVMVLLGLMQTTSPVSSITLYIIEIP